MPGPYRTPAPAPCTPRPTWRRRLAATLLPARWRCGRAARGGHWRPIVDHPGPHDDYFTRVVGWERTVPAADHDCDPCDGPWHYCEGHGPPVAPLRLPRWARGASAAWWLAAAGGALTLLLGGVLFVAKDVRALGYAMVAFAPLWFAWMTTWRHPPLEDDDAR